LNCDGGIRYIKNENDVGAQRIACGFRPISGRLVYVLPDV